MTSSTYTDHSIPSPLGSTSDDFKGFGFGAEVARGTRRRLVNQDGSFNVVRRGLNPLPALSLYHWSLTISWPKFLGIEDVRGAPVRKFYDLPLERERVTFFALSWTVVHPITPQSPLFGLTEKDLLTTEAELLILLTGTDETAAQIVHSRTSYRADEIQLLTVVLCNFPDPSRPT